MILSWKEAGVGRKISNCTHCIKFEPATPISSISLLGLLSGNQFKKQTKLKTCIFSLNGKRKYLNVDEIWL